LHFALENSALLAAVWEAWAARVLHILAEALLAFSYIPLLRLATFLEPQTPTTEVKTLAGEWIALEIQQFLTATLYPIGRTSEFSQEIRSVRHRTSTDSSSQAGVCHSLPSAADPNERFFRPAGGHLTGIRRTICTQLILEMYRIWPIHGSRRLMGRQSSILVDPFSPLHHQWVAWMLSG
jgi:hypothetical protein